MERLDPRLEDTLPPRRCGCVPPLSILYEDKIQSSDSRLEDRGLDDSGVVEDIGTMPRDRGGGWAKRIPLLGPFWCVRNTGSTTVRRRDNAVYRSNSFKFERRAPAASAARPEAGQPAQSAARLEQVLASEPVHHEAAFSHQSKKRPELLVNLNYSDPQDAESDLALWPGPAQGNVNQAYEAEDIVGLVSPPEDAVTGHQPPRPPSRGQQRGYHVKLGHDLYYCKPYQPFHTQLRYNFSDLLESGVDSEYEEMAGAAKWAANNNNNMLAMSGPGGGGGGACSQCVTVISVCPSPGHTLQPPGHQGHQRHPESQQPEPPYENLSFHKVTINVPDVGEDVHHLYTEKPRVLLRKPPLKKSKVPLKYQGIKRVKSKSKTQRHEHHSGQMTDKTGYSQKEVWNWLYLEEAAKNNGFNIEAHEAYPDDGREAAEAREKSVSVQFSPVEFLQATNRLAHLNLEGFERFVGNTIDRALAGARAKSSDVLDARDKDKETPVLDNQTPLTESSGGREAAQGDRDTDVYVGQDNPVTRESGQERSHDTRDPGQERTRVPPPASGGHTCGHSKVRPVCESCVRSGDSSCSSALSSLESVKSSVSQERRSDTSSSGVRSYLSSESGAGDMGRVATPGPGAHTDYIRMSGQRIYRGKVRASLPLGGHTGGHKPYQTLEVQGPDSGHSPMMCVSLSGPAPGAPGHQPLHLVDPSIQLHQQEWYHGNISRIEAEAALRLHPSGSYLVRNCESARKDYSLSLKSSHGFMHMRIQLTGGGQYILGQFSRPFNTIAEMINYYTVNRLPIKGAEHTSLRTPLCEQLL